MICQQYIIHDQWCRSCMLPAPAVTQPSSRPRSIERLHRRASDTSLGPTTAAFMPRHPLDRQRALPQRHSINPDT